MAEEAKPPPFMHWFDNWLRVACLEVEEKNNTLGRSYTRFQCLSLGCGLGVVKLVEVDSVEFVLHILQQLLVLEEIYEKMVTSSRIMSFPLTVFNDERQKWTHLPHLHFIRVACAFILQDIKDNKDKSCIFLLFSIWQISRVRSLAWYAENKIGISSDNSDFSFISILL